MNKRFGTMDELFENAKFTEDEEEEIQLEVKIINAMINARKKSKHTQIDVSKKAGIPQSTVARIETRKVVPNISTIIKYLNAIDYRLEVVPKK